MASTDTPAPRHGAASLVRSQAAMRRAEQVLTRGVASAARLRTRTPALQFARAEGSVVADLDGNEYVDFVLGLGPVLLGHRPPAVIAAAHRALDRAIVYGAQHEEEATLCELLVEAIPGAEIVSLCTTGSEAVQFAIRLARAQTGRRRIVKFDGHYHGWIDPLFVNAPWAAPVADGPTAPTHAVGSLDGPLDVTVARWNSLEQLERALAEGPPAAAVIMEPLPCNAGVIEPSAGYLEGARELCREAGALLVFDEVLTGFRLALGGAQERLGASPDLTICSKAVASGFPLSLVAGRRERMAPAIDGAVRPAGTANGFPPSVGAAIATVGELRTRGAELYPRLEALGAELQSRIAAAAAAAGAPLRVNRAGSVLQLLWGVGGPVREYADLARHDRDRVAELSARLLAHGMHTPERGLMLLCAAHSEEQIEAAGRAFELALAEITETGGAA